MTKTEDEGQAKIMKPYAGQAPHYGIQTDADGNVLVVLTEFNPETSHMDEVFVWRIEPHEIHSVVADLANQMRNAMDTVGRRITRGDCATCGNTSLVDEEKRNGSVMKVSCPDCTAGRSIEPFSQYPRIGGGLTRE